ncbi:hypothetical protein Droror1_Dr00009141 [Drosera rotundifolia]
MGQSTSSLSHPPPPPLTLTRRHTTHTRRRRLPPQIPIWVAPKSTQFQDPSPDFPLSNSTFDPTSDLPDECLAHIFLTLSSLDRKSCSLVCKRWYTIEGQSRTRLSLNATAQIVPRLPDLFDRFDSVTKLALRCDRRSVSVCDEGILMVALRCRNLMRLKLRGCRQVTDDGMTAFSRNCKGLRKLSCGSCDFGTKGLNSVIENCEKLEELSIKRLRGLNDQGMMGVMEPISGGIGAKSLRSVCLKELYNGQVFGPLIIGAKNLKSLKLIKCMGDWDRVLGLMSESNDGLVEVHLERLQVSDVGLSAIASCPKLEILHVVKAPDCSNAGVVAVTEKCRLLRKVHIDGWRTNRIGDEGLAALGKYCGNLQELVLIGLNPTVASLEVIASGCKNLERLALCSSETIRDAEISCIASKCVALKKFCIKSCPISDNGLEALAFGCPNLVKIKVKKCKEVTNDILEWLKERRESLVVNLDVDEIEAADASASEGRGAQEDGGSEPPEADNHDAIDVHPRARNGARSSLFRAKFGSLMGRSIAVRALRRWSSRNGTSSSNQ